MKSKRNFSFIILVFVSLLAYGYTILRKDTILIGGIQVNEKNQESWTTTLKKTGFNTVEVTVYAKQGDWDSENFWFDKKDTSIANEIRSAKNKGLNVVLILRLALDHAYEKNKFLWHGMIMPESKVLNIWCSKYEDFLKFWSDFAEKENVDVLGIGSEMNSLVTTLKIKEPLPLEEFYLNSKKQEDYNKRFLFFEDKIYEEDLWVRGNDNYQDLQRYLKDKGKVHRNWAEQICFYNDTTQNINVKSINLRSQKLNKWWHEMISMIRVRFSGKLTYAANFDNYQYITFWDKLDFIGINAYFPLKTINQESSDSIFTNSWINILNEISRFKRKHQLKQPVLFTELGYTNKNNCTTEPWNSNGFSALGNDSSDYKLYIWKKEIECYTERALAVKSLREAIKKTKFNFAGLLYWKLTTHDYHKKIEPFVLYFGLHNEDPLQSELIQFKDLPSNDQKYYEPSLLEH